MPRAVGEQPLLPLLGVDAVAQRRIDDDEPGADAAGLGDERGALLALQVAVEVAGEHPVEGPVGKRKGYRIAADDVRPGRALSRDCDHRRALIDPLDISA